jgi:hypothetical protein
MSTQHESGQGIIGTHSDDSCAGVVFRFRVDGKHFESSDPIVTGGYILRLANKCPDNYCLFRKGNEDQRRLWIGKDQEVDLSECGVEKFKTRKAFQLCIEDQTVPWCKRTITTEQIAALGGWDVSQGVVEVDSDQNERTLEPGEVVKLRPGHQYGKKHCWKRG